MSRGQAAVFVFREQPVGTGAAEYLALHRGPDHGNLWQPPIADRGSEAACRAVKGLGLTAIDVVEGDPFHAVDQDEETAEEQVFGIQVSPYDRPTLSDEHDAHLWTSGVGLSQVVQYTGPHHVPALAAVHGQISAALPNTPRGGFDEKHFSFIIIKPDAYELGADKEVIDKLGERGLTTVASIGGVALTERTVNNIWYMPNKTPWYYATVNYMSRHPVDIHLMEGDDASAHAWAVKAELRDAYDKNYRDDQTVPIGRRVESIMHCSDNMEELTRQAFNFFDARQLMKIVGGQSYATA